MEPVSRAARITGSIISGFIGLFMLFDGGIKVLRMAPAVEGTARLGYSTSLVLPIGVVGLRFPLCNSAYVDSGSYLADRFSRRCDRYPGARPGPVVPLSRCDWHDSLGGAVLDGRTIARTDPATKSEGGLLGGRVRDLAKSGGER